MSNTSYKPNGLWPIGTVSGASWNEQGNLYYIPTDGTNTYAIGDVVKSAGGADVNGIPKVVKATSGDVPLGIIVGFRVANPGVSLVGTNLDLTKPGFILKSAGDQYCMVVDDPNIIFEVSGDNTTALNIADLHKNANLTITADDTTNLASGPFSTIVVTSGSVNTTPTFVVRLLGAVQRVDNVMTSSTVAGTAIRLRAKWNLHEFGAAYVTSGNFTAS